MLVFTIVTFIAIYFANVSSDVDSTIVILDDLGKVKGSVLQNENGEDFLAFRGIPYAQPPVGHLRFQKPVEVKSWDYVFNATSYGNDCTQPNLSDSSKYSGDEDCLFLNVFTPRILKSDGFRLMPVMFWIHSGYLLVGSGAAEGPVRLLNDDIVLVTFNYRLGALGFLCTEDEESPGNYALFDQLLALKWVNKNIRKFGGDPTRVTIFGNSAGATSVTALMLSPLTKDLFSAAIVQSGTIVSDRFVEYKPLLQAQRLAQHLNCPSNTSKAIVDCLKSASGEIITVATSLIRKGEDLNGTFPFRPTIDQQFRQEPFFPNAPKVLFYEGKFHKVPILSGSVKDEGLHYYLTFARNSTVATTEEEAFTPENFKYILPIFAQEFYRDAAEGLQFASEMTEKYLPNQRQNFTTRELIEGIVAGITDPAVSSYIDLTNHLIASNHNPVFSYKVTYSRPDSNSKVFYKSNTAFKFVPEDLYSMVPHGDELQYLFSHNASDVLSERDRRMVKIMTSLWTSFAKTRTPSLPKDLLCESFNLTFRPMIPDKFSYLDINPDKPVIVESELSNKKEFLEKLNRLVFEMNN